MKTVILSPHTDDAIFSLGDYIQQLDDVTILSVFSGVPTDPAGQSKHVKLRKEHEAACDILGVKFINGDFLDDVYEPRPTEQEIVYFLSQYLSQFDQILCPIGIHHPDHVLLRNTVARRFRVEKFYKELPYAELYPEQLRNLKQKFQISHSTEINEMVSGLKRKAIECYQSQIQNDQIINQLLVPEELYD